MIRIGGYFFTFSSLVEEIISIDESADVKEKCDPLLKISLEVLGPNFRGVQREYRSAFSRFH